MELLILIGLLRIQNRIRVYAPPSPLLRATPLKMSIKAGHFPRLFYLMTSCGCSEDVNSPPVVLSGDLSAEDDTDQESQVSLTPPPNTPARIAMAELDAEEAAEEECIVVNIDQRATAWLNDLVSPPPAPRGKHAGGLPPSRLRFQQSNLAHSSQVSSFARVRKNLEKEALNTGNLLSSLPGLKDSPGCKNGFLGLIGSRQDPMQLSSMFGRA